MSGTVAVVVVSLAASRADVAGALEICSDAERARALRFRHDDDRARFALGHALVRRWCALRLACDPREVALMTTDRGKPEIPGTRLAFNVAHGGDRIVLAARARGRRRRGTRVAEGSGLAGDVRGCSVATPSAGGFAWRDIVALPSGATWRVVPCDAGDAHVAAVAVPPGTVVCALPPCGMASVRFHGT